MKINSDVVIVIICLCVVIKRVKNINYIKFLSASQIRRCFFVNSRCTTGSVSNIVSRRHHHRHPSNPVCNLIGRARGSISGQVPVHGDVFCLIF